jgi:hypothetical protein
MEKTIEKLDSRIDRKEKQLQKLKEEGEAQSRTIETLMGHFSQLADETEMDAQERMIQGILIDCDLKSDTMATIMAQLQCLEREKKEKREALKEQLQKEGQAGNGRTTPEVALEIEIQKVVERMLSH